MTALELVTLVTQAIYVVLFVAVALHAARRPTRARIDTALFFAAATVIVGAQTISARFGAEHSEPVEDLIGAVAMTLPYLLVRLVDDFSRVPALLVRGAELGLVLGAASFVLVPGAIPPPLELALVGYFGGLFAYSAFGFVRAARRSVGPTRRRMQAVATGSFLLAIGVLANGLVPVLIPAFTDAASFALNLLALGSGLAYFTGFAPPGLIRRAWQEPELRRFLRQAASLPRLPDTDAIVRALETGAATTLGARAAIGLYEPSTNTLRFRDPYGVLPAEIGPGAFLVWRVFESQRAEYFPDPVRAHPELAPAYRKQHVASLLIAPISAGGRRLGALEAYTDHSPVFSEDDLELTQLFADQAAVILESRSLIDEAARVRAHEEAARLKEDFLSAAAHDLKTPLTTLVAQAQFLERRAQADPSAPADVGGIRRIVREAKRLSGLVIELLDAARLEQGRLVGEREPIDLVELARDIATRDAYTGRRISVSADAPVVGSYDPRRIGQVIENLVENAVKYSAEKSEVRLDIAQQNGLANIVVKDEGIGIPPEDLPLIFERFHRASNVDDRRFAGMGLGLFICRGIVELHGGRIWVESRVGEGTTFHVALPCEVRP